MKATLEDWKKNNKVKRLWARDASLWTNKDEANWLGWLGIVEEQIAHDADFKKIADEIHNEGFTHLVLLGMGGSSLCVEVFGKTFGKIDGYPQVHILDSTDPAQIRTLESKIDIAKTIFIVASKSGTTLEPNIFEQYFYEKVKQSVGAAEAGKRFIATTDPGSQMQKVAESSRLPPCFLRCAEHRRAIFRAVEFRNDSCGYTGRGRAKVSRPRRRNGPRLRLGGSRG